jgi:hypothetical protein
MPFLALLVEGELRLVNPHNSLCGERALNQERKKEKNIFHDQIPHLGMHDSFKCKYIQQSRLRGHGGFVGNE